MSIPGPIILDTNVLVHLIRADAAGVRIADAFDLLTRQARPLVSLMTVGEMQALARKLHWGEGKRTKLDELVRELVVVGPHQGNIVSKYAEIDFYCEQGASPARPIGQNDMWIAATAAETDATLITSDNDFDHLSPKFIKLQKVHARTGDPL